MSWTDRQIKAEISALEFEYGIAPGEFLTIVKRESKNFEYNGRIHPDGVSKGLAGITDGAIQEYENFTGNSFPDYMDEYANLRVGAWYWGKRIPQMLRAFKKQNTWQNRLISYNAGISYVTNDTPLGELPSATQNYIEYFKQELYSQAGITNIIGIMLLVGAVAKLAF